MQPHTGAVIAVINFLTPSVVSFPESFIGKIFDVQTTTCTPSGSFISSKYHSIKFTGHNENSKELEFKVGKSYACYLIVQYDSSFEKFEFIKHRHTNTREKFTIYKRSENFSGEYSSEDGHRHRIEGRKVFSKETRFIDTHTYTDDKNQNQELRLKYIMKII